MAEKNLFENVKTTYHGVVVSAHLASFYKVSMTTFLTSLGKPFFVDPMTYVFARDIQNIKRGDEFRKSYQKLIDWYGGKIKQLLQQRQLLPTDFVRSKKWNKETLNIIVKKTIELQVNLLKPSGPVQQSLQKYFEIMEQKIPKISKPSFVVAPYFYFTSISDVWYTINLQLARLTTKSTKEDVFAVICTSKEILLDEKAMKKMSNDFKQFKGLIIWFSNLDDEKDAVEYLNGLVKLFDILERNKKPTHILYGGSFIPFLAKKFRFLQGYSRGICYGDSRDVDTEASKGGGMPVRYYMGLTKTKLSESVARLFYSENPAMLCKCKVCSSVSNTLPKSKKTTASHAEEFFDKVNFLLARQHFAHSHANEVGWLSKNSKTTILKMLATNIKKVGTLNLNFKYGIQVSHLDRWRDTLSK